MSNGYEGITLSCPRCGNQVPVLKTSEDPDGWLRMSCLCQTCRVIFLGMVSPQLNLRYMPSSATIH